MLGNTFISMTFGVLLALAPLGARAGGGPDHDHGGEAAPAAVVPAVATAEAAGLYELLLKAPRFEADHPLTLQVFVADPRTNAPVEAKVKLALSGPKELSAAAEPLGPGRLSVDLGEAPAGRYAVTATVTGPAGVDLLTTELVLESGAHASPAPAPHDDHGEVPLLWLVLALVLAALLGWLGYVAGRRVAPGGADGRAGRHGALGGVGGVGAGLVFVLGAAMVGGEVEAHGGEDHDHGGPAEVAAAGAAVRLQKDVQFLLEVRSQRAERRDLVERRRVPGAVVLPPGARAALVAPFSGRIEAAPDGGFPTLGAKVEKGQVLAALVEIPIAADRAGLAAERARAAGARDAAAAGLRALRLELERKRALTGIVAAQELTTLEAAVAREAAELQAARAAVEALSLGRGAAVLELVAPIDGVIGAIGVSPGGLVDAGAALLEVVDLRRPWVAAKVFEGELGAVDRQGEALVLTDEGSAVPARLVAVSPSVDPASRTVDVQYALTGEAELRQHQFVRVDLPVGAAREVVAVPERAVVELDGVPSLWVKHAAEVFEAVPVALGRREGGLVEARGLAEGAVVVIEGAPFLRGAPPATLTNGGR